MRTANPKGLGFADIKPILEEVVQGLKGLYGERLAQLVLYGSYARGEAHDESDVDLLLLLHGEIKAFEEIERANNVLWPLSLEHDILLGVVPASLEAFEQMRMGKAFVWNVQREGIRLI